MSPPRSKPWGGRFRQATDAAVERFTASIHFDQALAAHDVRSSQAHVRMLCKQGLVSEADEAALLAGLEAIAGELAAGSFPLDPALEDIHMNIEACLRERVGEAAGRLHTGRSRNDLVATDLLLYLRDASRATQHGLLELRRTLAARAREHLDTVLPGYTHLQRAQPVRLAHHWLAYCEMLGRDGQRFRDLERRLSLSPLGAGALAGSTLELPPPPRQMRNSLDAVADRDFALDYLYAAAVLFTHLSRVGEEIVLWSTAEFGFVRLPEAAATGSSMMPQKLNPDVAELVRGKAGTAIGRLTGLLATVKGLPLAYDRDLQTDKQHVREVFTVTSGAFRAMAGLLSALKFDTKALAEAVSDPALLATDMAEDLVRGGTPFRQAHEQVAASFRKRKAVETPKSAPRASVQARSTDGGPSKASVGAQVRELRQLSRPSD